MVSSLPPEEIQAPKQLSDLRKVELLHASSKSLPSIEAGARIPQTFEELLRALTVLPEVGLAGLGL